uniref:RING-type domain-containing protein n=1 Tax=Poecilia reticulata TaxID=8081 RepID=A0A3P9QHF3_POERE
MKNNVGEEEQPSCCALCQEVLVDPVSTSCGHWFCRQCIRFYWDQSTPSGPSSCPQCGERPRTGPIWCLLLRNNQPHHNPLKSHGQTIDQLSS